MQPFRQRTIRGMLALLGLGSLIWSCATLPTFWALLPLNALADRILSDDYFKPGALREVLSGLDVPPDVFLSAAQIARTDAVLKLQAAEVTLDDGDVASIDRRGQAAEDAVRTSLQQNPSDSFLWMMLFSIENARNGFDSENLRFLAESYALGPLEGWIALRRNRLALGAFPTLNRELQNLVLGEFATMVDTNFTEEAVVNLKGVGWAYRERLLAGLSSVDIVSRQRLSSRLLDDGIKIKIPGVAYEERPWR